MLLEILSLEETPETPPADPAVMACPEDIVKATRALFERAMKHPRKGCGVYRDICCKCD